MWLWQSGLGTLLLYSALAIHASLGLWALYERRHFRFKASEAVQLVFGLSIPLLLGAHVVSQRIGLDLYGIERGYAQALHTFWVASPTRGALQAVALVVAWIHACIGLYFWLRLKSFFRRAAPTLLAAAVLLPTLALLGFYQSGRAVAALGSMPAWQADNLSPGQVGTPEQNAGLAGIRDNFLYAWAVAIVLVLSRAAFGRSPSVAVVSSGSRTPTAGPFAFRSGLSVLEASWRFNIPHACVCGGRGRCSTCRIRIVGDRRALPPPSPREIGRAGARRLR